MLPRNVSHPSVHSGTRLSAEPSHFMASADPLTGLPLHELPPPGTNASADLSPCPWRKAWHTAAVAKCQLSLSSLPGSPSGACPLPPSWRFEGLRLFPRSSEPTRSLSHQGSFQPRPAAIPKAALTHVSPLLVGSLGVLTLGSPARVTSLTTQGGRRRQPFLACPFSASSSLPCERSHD